MNILLFASDQKYYAILKNLWTYIRDTIDSDEHSQHKAMFVFSNTQLTNYDLQSYSVDATGNILADDLVVLNHGLSVLKPDWLLVSRERWQPEQWIQDVFMQNFNTKVGVVEANSHVINNIETWMEMESRYNYPQSDVHTFFEHSQWTADRRRSVWTPSTKNRIEVVGNPRWDNPDAMVEVDEQSLLDKYSVGSRKILLVFSVINTSRIQFLDALKSLTQKVDPNEYCVIYSPYAGEPYNDKFKSQFNGNTIVYDNGVITLNISYDEREIYTLAKMAHAHVCQLNSIFCYGLSYGKPIVCLNSVMDNLTWMNDVSRYGAEVRNGVEDSASFWASLRGMTPDEWIQWISVEKKNVLDDITDTTNAFWKDIVSPNVILFDHDMNFLQQLDSQDALRKQEAVRPYFDSFWDGGASERIFKYIIGDTHEEH